jgi:hypothetical protein
MATLKLMRPEEKVNRLAEMVVYLNGQPLGVLLNNEIKEFAIPAGQHKLKAKIDTQGSKVYRFSIVDAETKIFILSTDTEANKLAPFGSGAIFIDIIVNAFLLLYSITIGHNRYLTINELK